MKKIYTAFVLLVSLQGFAAVPTVPASNLHFAAIDGGYFNIGWTAGNGTRRIIICKAGGPVSFTPQNAVDYTENTNFGSGQQVAPGEFVIYDNAFTSFYLTGLTPATQYFFAVFEYNGTGATTEYLTSSYLTGSATTSATPTVQTSNASFSNISTNSVTVTWSNGNGSRRLIVAHEGAPVNADPVNSQPYNANNAFGSGAAIGTGNFALYGSSGTSTAITNLKPATTYYFAFYEYNGSSQPQYLVPAFTSSITTRSIPTVPSSNIIISKTDGRELSLTWTNGNGQRRIVVAKEGTDITGIPANGTDYAANATFGAGPVLGPGEYVVYDDNFNAATITGLKPATNYYFKIFEYDGTGSNTIYLTSSFASTNAPTAFRPTLQASNISATNITASSFNMQWTSGNGRARLIVGRKDLPVNVEPADLTTYTDNADLGNGNFVAAITTDAFAAIHNLESNTSYHFAIFEFNGYNQPLYLSPAAVFNVTMAAGSLPVKLGSWDAVVVNDRVIMKWTSNAEINTSHFVVERSTDAVQFYPIASISAAGNSQGNKSYSTVDENPISGRSYYRLRMVDQDGHFEISPIRTVLLSAKKAAYIVRNPVNQVMEIVSSFACDWQIINAGGQVVLAGKIGSGRSNINVSALPAGAFWMRLYNNPNSETLRFMKQ